MLSGRTSFFDTREVLIHSFGPHCAITVRISTAWAGDNCASPSGADSTQTMSPAIAFALPLCQAWFQLSLEAGFTSGRGLPPGWASERQRSALKGNWNPEEGQGVWAELGEV